jgi:hypothetical protein
MKNTSRQWILAGLIPVLIGAASVSLVLGRELWFDEAMTVTSFMLPFGPLEIYTNYSIPNNQIVYTMALKLWHGLLMGGYPAPVAYWRLLSLAAATGAAGLFFLTRRKLRDRTPWTAAIVLSVFAVSPLFRNYASALRGYALSWFWIMLALEGARRIFHGRGVCGWILYLAGTLGAVGTVPTNLLACAGVVVYAFPWSRRDFLRDGRLWMLAAGPLLCLAVFYGPIWRAFLHSFTLNEGFPDRAGALAVIYGATVVTFGILLPAEAVRLKRGDWRGKLRVAVWLLPVPAVLFLHQAPFPRVFCTLFPLYMMLLADGLNGIRFTRIRTAAGLGILVVSLAVLRVAAPTAAAKAGLSEYEDDFFRPWYMAEEYSVCELLPEIGRHPELPFVFQSFDSDPCPLIFYATLEGVEKDFHPDQPPGYVEALPGSALVVLRRDEKPGDYEARFGGTLSPLFSGRDCIVFRFLRRPSAD